MPKLAIVIPCYNEEAVIEHSFKVLCEKLENLISKKLIDKDSFLCFVDDGSRDKTCEILLHLKKQNHAIVKLSKNYGHQNALLAGLEFVQDKCDCVVSMDCDLQDDINAIDAMLEQFKNGAEIVYGVRKARDKDTMFKKTTALGFYRFMHFMGVKILYNHADYRLLSNRVLGHLLEFSEVNLFVRGIIPLLGFKSCKLYYKRKARQLGVSKYPFFKMLSFAIDGITSFSVKPLRILTFMGAIISAFSIIVGIWALVTHFMGYTVSGWTSMISVMCLLGGIQLLGLGIMGEYIGKIYKETKKRPLYFVDEVIE